MKGVNNTESSSCRKLDSFISNIFENSACTYRRTTLDETSIFYVQKEAHRLRVQLVAPIVRHVVSMRHDLGNQFFRREHPDFLRDHTPRNSQNRSEESQVEEHGPVLSDFEMEEYGVKYRQQEEDRRESARYESHEAAIATRAVQSAMPITACWLESW
jgi:hypothetical protein